MYAIEHLRIALEELDAFYESLEAREEGRGEALLSEVQRAKARLLRFPFAYARQDGEIRRLDLGKTGYGLFYIVRGKRIILTAFFYETQDLEPLKQRLPSELN